MMKVKTAKNWKSNRSLHVLNWHEKSVSAAEAYKVTGVTTQNVAFAANSASSMLQKWAFCYILE